MHSSQANSTLEERVGVWGQFRASLTPGHPIFDIVFGIVMPLVCFYFDPGIIRGNFSTPLRHVSIFIYGFSGLAIFTLALWLAMGHRMQSLSAAFGVVLFAGAICSFSIGVVILPVTLIGLFFVIGVLGFVPFVTGFVYLRNGLKAIKRVNMSAAGSPRIAMIVLSAVLVTCLPAFAQWKINDIVERSMTEILSRDAGSADAAIRRIRRFQWIVDADKLVREYERETNGPRRERLGRAYKEITGVDIETRLSTLND